MLAYELAVRSDLKNLLNKESYTRPEIAGTMALERDILKYRFPNTSLARRVLMGAVYCIVIGVGRGGERLEGKDNVPPGG